jgi:eukaryotic-like serine/threonine-protein kinase
MNQIFKICTVIFMMVASFSCSGQKNTDSVMTVLQSPHAVKWRFKSSQPFMSSPEIEGSTIYIGSLDSNFYALDLTSGNIEWKFKTNGAIRSTACINNNRVLFTSGDGNLYSLDKTNGKEIWVFKTKGDHQYDIYDYHQSSPVIDNGKIYFGSGDNNMYAVNASDGKMIWSFTTGNVVHSTAAISNNKLFIGSFDGYVYALDKRDGKMIWKFKTVGHDYFPKGEVQFSPTVCDGMVYIGARDYNLYALDSSIGICHWNREFPAGWVPAVTPSQKNDSIIYVETSDPLLLLAINGITENTLWKTNLKSEIFGHLAMKNEMGYVGTLEGKFYGVDLKTGKIQWTFSTDGFNTNHQKYYKPDDTFRDDIFSILKSNEDFMKAGFSCGSIYSSAVVASDLLIVSSTDGTVYCLKGI